MSATTRPSTLRILVPRDGSFAFQSISAAEVKEINADNIAEEGYQPQGRLSATREAVSHILFRHPTGKHGWPNKSSFRSRW